MNPTTAELIVEALQASAALAPVIAAGFATMRTDFSASDQAAVDQALADAKAKLDADIARIEQEP